MIKFPIKTILIIPCGLAIIGLTLFTDVNRVTLGLISHQPRTFQQMELLITPDHPDVAEALAAALGEDKDVGVGKQSAVTAGFDRIREWVSSNIGYCQDEQIHGVSDYWQLPSETLALGTGDCEDYAILLVSLLRALGVPSDQVYVAVGYDSNGICHAQIVERYYTDVWRIVDAESASEASFVDSANGRSYDISYCFNDEVSFRGLPDYPSGYVVPEIAPPPTISKPRYDYVRLQGVPVTGWFDGEINLINPGFDAIKRRMGKLWIPGYLPEGYFLSRTVVGGNWLVGMDYHKEGSSNYLYVNEIPSGVYFTFPEGTVKEVMVNNQKAYLVQGSWTGSSTNPFETWREDRSLNLIFVLDNWVVTLRGELAKSWTSEELMKIAESMRAY